MTAPKLTIGQLSFDISAGDNLAQAAPFTPLAVMVDNYSPYYLLLPDAGSYVPPWTIGAILPLIHASICQATWANPESTAIATIPYVAAAGFAHLRFLDTALPSSAGTSLSQSGLTNGVSFSAAVGNSITITPNLLTFLAIGLRIDNPSGTSYQIVETSQVIPMFTSGWTIDIDPPFNTLTIVPYQIPGTLTNKSIGGPITAFLYPYNIGQNGGTTIPTSFIPYFISATTNTVTGTSIPITIPTPQVGDLVVFAIGMSGSTSGYTITPPANVTTVSSVYKRVIDGTEGTNPTFTFTSNLSATYQIVAIVYRGTQGLVNVSSSGSVAGVNLASENITPFTIPWIALFIMTDFTTSYEFTAITTPPLNMITRISQSGMGAFDTNALTSSAAYATGTGSITGNGYRWYGIVIA